MPGDAVRVVTDDRAIRALSSSDEMRDLLMDLAAPVVTRAQYAAPRRTGAGAASIRAEPVLDIDSWTVRIGWERVQYHMYFHERGTRYLPATNFLEESLEEGL
jgi:hypothetical protein